MLVKPRNPFGLSPYLKKGGAHDKTNKAKRKLAKNQLNKELASLKKNRRSESSGDFFWALPALTISRPACLS